MAAVDARIFFCCGFGGGTSALFACIFVFDGGNRLEFFMRFSFGQRIWAFDLQLLASGFDEFGVDLSADEDGYRREIKPEHECDDAAQGAVGSVVVGKLADVDAEAQ